MRKWFPIVAQRRVSYIVNGAPISLDAAHVGDGTLQIPLQAHVHAFGIHCISEEERMREVGLA